MPTASTRRIRLARLLVAGAGFAWLAAKPVAAAEAASSPPASTEAQSARAALQVIRANCLDCHGDDKRKGGLALTSREALLKGGDNGTVAVPGRPDSSTLLKALHKGADPHMPPKKQLGEAEIRAIGDWIRRGLPWDARVLTEELPLLPVTLKTLPANYRPVMSVAFSPTNQLLALARGGVVEVRDLAATNFPALAQSPLAKDPVQALAWSPDGRWVASGSFRRVALWSGATLKLEREWTNGIAGTILAVEFSPDGRLMAIGDGEAGRSGWIRLIELESAKVTAAWLAHGDSIFDLDFSRDGRRLVSAGGDRLVKVWDVESQKEIGALEGHTAQVLGAAFNTNATQVVSGSADRQLKVWDVATKEKIVTLGNQAAGITAVSWPGDGSAIFATTDSGTVFRYTNLKAHTGEQSSATADERQLGALAESALCLAARGDGKRVIAGGHDGLVHVWDEEGKEVVKFAPPTSPADSGPDLGEPSPAVRRIGARDPRNPASATAAGPRTSPIGFQLSSVVSLSVEPRLLLLTADAPRHGIRVTAKTADGFELDVTSQSRLSVRFGAPFALDDRGDVIAAAPGEGVLAVRFGTRQVDVPVSVAAFAGGPLVRTNGSATNDTSRGPRRGKPVLEPSPASFVRDVLPALSRVGCNAGSCHAKPEGQNGFKLSVFSYDPRHDYAEIVRDSRGRRVFPAAPDESLIIQKPTTAVPHEGGERFARGSETHQLLRRWIREGMAYSLPGEPVLERLTVFPRERRYRKGAMQPLLVQARYSDGSTRDVTRLAAYVENDKELARVDEHGVVSIGSLTGQGVIVARYMGLVADSQVLVPAEKLLPESRYAALPKHSFIDEFAYAQFQRLGLFPSELCTDAEFLRRASLDAIGVLPSPEEVRAFAKACDDESQEKEKTAGREGDHDGDPSRAADLAMSGGSAPRAREQLIDRLLERPEFADYWANKWADLLRPNPDRVGVKSVLVLDEWLRESFRENRPYDRFVRDILLAEGSNHRHGPAVIYRDRREPPELTTMFSQLFLGMRLECARCHHHPNEKWSQDDFYQFAAYFGPVKQKGAGLSPPISAGTETFYFAPGGTVKHPVTGEVMAPRPPDASAPALPEGADPRAAFADWLTAADNPFFARAAVNRVWANFFGRGLVEPVDDFRISNPCVNPPLLDALARDFAVHHYDLKHLVRTILESRLYQLSGTPNDTNLADTRNFSRSYRRRLPAEVLLDAVNDATRVPDTYAATPVGFRAMQTWSYKIESQFMDAFSRPNPSSDPPCERDRQMSVIQSLHLMNSKNLQAKLGNPAGRVHELVESTRPVAEVITELYLATLSRPPSADELTVAEEAFSVEGAKRKEAAEDVFWALLNSPEFVFNH